MIEERKKLGGFSSNSWTEIDSCSFSTFWFKLGESQKLSHFRVFFLIYGSKEN